MSTILLEGKPVAQAIYDKALKTSKALEQQGITPVVALVRVGENPADISYENSIKKNMAKGGVSAVSATLSQGTTTEKVLETIDTLNKSPLVHGIMLFRPMPEHIDGEWIRHAIHPAKDVDGITDMSLGGVFTGSGIGFAPCTAQAVIEMLDYYGIELRGKKVAVVGRSLVIGKPVSMLLLKENATVTICHSRTQDLKAVTKQADILVCAMGKAEFVDSSFVKEGAVVMDVGINFKDGRMVGDANYDDVSTVAGMVTPVPGGVGSVTTALLLRHTVLSAVKKLQKNI